MDRNPRRPVRAPRIMGKYYGSILDLLVARGFASPRAPVRLGKLAKLSHPPAIRVHLMKPNVHIIGAGVSGLAAAVRLSNAGFGVHLHEATPQAGGRCRSFHDAATDLMIDNGNHLVLSGNTQRARLCTLDRHRGRPRGTEHAEFAFIDLKAGKRWLLQMNDGRIPFWIFRTASACRTRSRPTTPR